MSIGVQGPDVTVVADQRETRSGVPALIEGLGATLLIETLEVGDYCVSNRVMFERKTTADFLKSVIENKTHLFGQLSDMARSYSRPILILEGEMSELYTTRAISPNAIDGMLMAVAKGFGIPILYTFDVEHTSRIIYRAAVQEQVNEKRPISLHGKRSHMSLPKQQEYVVSAIGSGVGPALAITLLNHFKSVEAIMSAPVHKLTEVDGIGKVTADKIRHILTSKYKPK